MKENVLVFPGGSYNGIQIFFCLKNNLLFHIILGSSYEDHSSFICNDIINNLPYSSDPQFVSKMNDFIDNRNIKFIIPTHDTMALTLMQHADKLHATIVCSPLETALICRYKSKTYEILRDYNFIPKTYTFDSLNMPFPIFAKNDIGQGGQNSYVIRSAEELASLEVQNIDFVLCEYLPGEEITVDCFTDRHGNTLFIQPRTRERIMNGISVRSRTTELTEEILNIAHSISQKIVFHGFWFFQCKKDTAGKWKLMEISTRFSGSFGVSKSKDVNLPLIALCDFAGLDVSVMPNIGNVIADKTYIDRYKIDYDYKRVYLDFDDTLVFNRTKYNTFMMQYLYQCLNEHKEIVLITKHAFDIYDTLQKLHIPRELFSDVINVPEDEFKYIYIKIDVPAILIDNAFTERMLVKKHLGIPAFDPSNVDCLIDWSM